MQSGEIRVSYIYPGGKTSNILHLSSFIHQHRRKSGKILPENSFIGLSNVDDECRLNNTHHTDLLNTQKNAGFSWASAPGLLEGRLPMPLVIIGFTYGESPSFKVLGSMLRLGLSGPTSPATISPVGNVNKEKSWRRRRSRLKLIASRLHWVTWRQGWLPCRRTSWQKLGTPAVGGLLSDLCWPRPILLLPSSFFLFSSLLLSPH